MANNRNRWQWAAASYGFALLATLCVAVPLLEIRGDILGYFASIAGGLIGGAMTVFAGWLAYSAAQRQIDQQAMQLTLMIRENNLRESWLLRELRENLQNVLDAVSLSIAILDDNYDIEKDLRDALTATGMRSATEIMRLLQLDGSWRLDPGMVSRLRDATVTMTIAHSYVGLARKTPPATIAERVAQLEPRKKHIQSLLAELDAAVAAKAQTRMH